MKLVSESYGGIRAALAKAIETEPSYISRMLYPFGKAGYKGIGEDMVEKITKLHPNWLSSDMAPGEYEVNEVPAAYTANKISSKKEEFINLIAYNKIPDDLIDVLTNMVEYAVHGKPAVKEQAQEQELKQLHLRFKDLSLAEEKMDFFSEFLRNKKFERRRQERELEDERKRQRDTHEKKA